MSISGVNSTALQSSLLSYPQTQLTASFTQQTDQTITQTTNKNSDNLWNEFWHNFDWKDGAVSFSAIVGGLLASSILYKPVRGTGVTKTLDKTFIGDFYRKTRDKFIDGYGERTLKVKDGEEITIQKLFDSFTPNERKKYLESFVRGDYEAVQKTLDEIADKFNVPKKNLRTILNGLDQQIAQYGTSISDRVNWTKGQTFLGELVDETKEQVSSWGVNYDKALDEILNNDQNFKGFVGGYVNQVAGRLSSLILVYTLIAMLGNQIIQQSEKDLSEEEKKEIKKRKEDTADPLGFIEDIFLMLAGGATGYGLGRVWKMKGLPLKLLAGIGALGGFALAQLIHNVINFTYKKVQDKLPKEYKDSNSIKTLVTILMGTLIGTLLSAKAIFAKFAKFTGAIKNKGLRPTSNLMINGFLYRYSSNLSTQFAASHVGIHPEEIAKSIDNPAESGHLFANPYNYLVHVMKGRDYLVSKVKEKNKAVGTLTEFINHGLDAVYDFPLLRKMAEKHPNGDMPINAEFWARSSGDMVYKFAGVGILNLALLTLFSPFIYLGNLFNKAFKKDDDSSQKATT